ncbi:ankyrin repeat-containing domain protein, partial [Russula brevipes]
GHLQVMELLLERGADVDMQTISGPLLHIALCHGEVKVVRLLLRHNADVHARGTWDWTALHWASGNGRWSVVKLLL